MTSDLDIANWRGLFAAAPELAVAAAALRVAKGGSGALAAGVFVRSPEAVAVMAEKGFHSLLASRRVAERDESQRGVSEALGRMLPSEAVEALDGLMGILLFCSETKERRWMFQNALKAFATAFSDEGALAGVMADEGRRKALGRVLTFAPSAQETAAALAQAGDGFLSLMDAKGFSTVAKDSLAKAFFELPAQRLRGMLKGAGPGVSVFANERWLSARVSSPAFSAVLDEASLLSGFTWGRAWSKFANDARGLQDALRLASCMKWDKSVSGSLREDMFSGSGKANGEWVFMRSLSPVGLCVAVSTQRERSEGELMEAMGELERFMGLPALELEREGGVETLSGEVAAAVFSNSSAQGLWKGAPADMDALLNEARRIVRWLPENMTGRLGWSKREAMARIEALALMASAPPQSCLDGTDKGPLESKSV